MVVVSARSESAISVFMLLSEWLLDRVWELG